MAGVSNMRLKKTAGAIAISVVFLGGMTFIGSTEAQTIATQLDTSINKALADSLLRLSNEIKLYRLVLSENRFRSLQMDKIAVQL
jgi:hypothetical protein